jgi:hypothetical protein
VNRVKPKTNTLLSKPPAWKGIRILSSLGSLGSLLDKNSGFASSYKRACRKSWPAKRSSAKVGWNHERLRHRMGGGKGGRSAAVSGAHFSGVFREPASPGQARDSRERGRAPCVGIGRRFSRPCGFVGARREVDICQHGHPGPAPPRAIRVQGGRGRQAVDGREAQAPYLRLEQSFVSKRG